MINRCALAALVLVPGAAVEAAVRTDVHGHRTPGEPLGQAAAGSPAAAGVPDWVALGPFGGDAAAVAASPADSSIALAGIAPASGGGGALYRSTDGGATWSIVPALDGTSVFDIEFAPDGTAYIGTQDSVWKSTDDGATWTQAALGIGPNDTVLEVSIDPSFSSVIWIGIADALGSQPVNVMRSTNGGSTWIDRTPPLASPLGGTGIAVDPTDSARICACFAGGFAGGEVWISDDGGNSWTDRSAGLPNNPMNDILHDGARILVAGGQLFGSQFVGLYESLDDGATWTALHDGSWPLLVINDVELDPNDADTMLAVSAGAGVYRSTDGGDTWSFGIGDTGSLSVNSVRFAPGSSLDIFLGASSAGVLRSIDGGATFDLSSTGIGALNVVSVDANPLDATELAIAFQGLNDGGVQTSTDGGATWTLEPLPATRFNTVRFAPDGTLYAISDGPTTVAPEGLYRREGDGTWTGIGPDQGPVFESELFALRFSQNNPDLILSGGSDFGVVNFEPTIWLSDDGGATWTKVYEGPVDNEDVRAIEIVEDGTDQVMVAAFTDFGELQTGGALRSTDGGLTWSDASAGLPAGAQGFGLCASPADADTMFLADGDGGAGVGGVHVTTDAGQTWTSTGFVQPLMRDIVCDPTDAQVLYVAEFSGELVRRSEDQGATFAPFNAGLADAGNGQDLAYAADTPPRLLLATSTGTFARALDTPCPWDLDASGDVGTPDFLALLAAWGPNPGHPADFDDDGTVGTPDFLALLANWGPCP